MASLVGLPESAGRDMSQGAWAKFKGWLAKNDMLVIPQCIHTDTTMPIVEPAKSQNATVIGRITQLNDANMPDSPQAVRPIAERLRKLAKKASGRRQVASKPKRRSAGKP